MNKNSDILIKQIQNSHVCSCNQSLLKFEIFVCDLLEGLREEFADSRLQRIAGWEEEEVWVCSIDRHDSFRLSVDMYTGYQLLEGIDR